MLMRFILTLAVVQFSCTAFAGSFIYKISDFSWPEGSTCDTAIAQIAANLETKYQAQVEGSLCETDSVLDRTNGLIRYSASEQLNLVSTYTYNAIYDDKGVFRTREDCEASLSSDVAVFTEQTGLEPLFSQCAYDRSTSRANWYVRIEAFGNPAKVPARTSWNSNRPYGYSADQLFSWVAEQFAKYDHTLVHINWDAGASIGRGVTAFFYAAPNLVPVRASAVTLATIPGIDACTSQAEVLWSQLDANADVDPLATYCTSGYSNPTRFELEAIVFGMDFFDMKLSATEYESLEACEADRETQANRLRIVYGDDLVATVCGHERFRFRRGQPYKVIGLKR